MSMCCQVWGAAIGASLHACSRALNAAYCPCHHCDCIFCGLEGALQQLMGTWRKPPRSSRKDLNSALALSRLAFATCASVSLNTRFQGSKKAAFWSPKTRLLTKMSFWKVCSKRATNRRSAPQMINSKHVKCMELLHAIRMSLEPRGTIGRPRTIELHTC